MVTQDLCPASVITSVRPRAVVLPGLGCWARLTVDHWGGLWGDSEHGLRGSPERREEEGREKTSLLSHPRLPPVPWASPAVAGGGHPSLPWQGLHTWLQVQTPERRCPCSLPATTEISLRPPLPRFRASVRLCSGTSLSSCGSQAC